MRFLTAVLTMTVLALTFTVGMPLRASAAAIIDNGDYVFRVLDDGKSAEIIQYVGKSLYVSMPTTVDKYKVTQIGPTAFMYNDTMKELEIPGSIEKIGSNAFASCTALRRLDINGNVEDIEECAFINCPSLETVTINEGVMNFGDSVFSGCSSLKSIVFPNSTLTIGKYALFNCSSLENITIPPTVRELGGYALEGTKWMKNQKGDFVLAANGILIRYNGKEKSRSLPDTVKRIGDFAFAGNKQIDTILLPRTVTVVGKSAFEGCESLTEVTLPDGVSRIGERAFAGCTLLNNVILPSKLKVIESSVFAGCSSLSAITIPGSVETIRTKAFEKCTMLKNLKLQNGIKTIEEFAFANCDSLGRVILPESLSDLHTAVFSNCINLTRAEFNGTSEIPLQPFQDCRNLEEVVFFKNPNGINEYAFSNSTGDLTFYSDESLTVQEYARRIKAKSENIKNLPTYVDRGVIELNEQKEEEKGFSGTYTFIVIMIVIVDVAVIVLFSFYILFFGNRRKKKRPAHQGQTARSAPAGQSDDSRIKRSSASAANKHQRPGTRSAGNTGAGSSSAPAHSRRQKNDPHDKRTKR